MNGRCRSTLAALAPFAASAVKAPRARHGLVGAASAADGFSPAALRRLIDGRKRLSSRLAFTRAEVIRYRAGVADRMSISGVQDKVSLRFEHGALAPTEADGEFILKPIPGTPLPRHTDQVPANEHLTMQIAEQVFGISTAVNALVEMSDGEPAYLTRRFDRRGSVRLDMEDFCALSEQSPETHGQNYKYSGSYERIGHLMRRFCPAFLVEVEKLFIRVVFNYAVGNGDAHLKNFSLFTSPDGDPVLTPAYDLVNTNLHLPNETRLALDLFADGHETPAFTAFGFPSSSDFLLLSERLGVVPRRARMIIDRFTAEDSAQAVERLIGRSFLSEDAQALYREVVRDRRLALQQ